MLGRGRAHLAAGGPASVKRLLAFVERPKTRRLPGHRATGSADVRDHLDVLLLDALDERDLLEQILEPVRLEHDADDVGAVGLVVADELLREHALGSRSKASSAVESSASRVQLAPELQ